MRLAFHVGVDAGYGQGLIEDQISGSGKEKRDS